VNASAEETPLVSIILIGYNDEQRIGRALRSLTHQTLHNLEIIVVDDASTDGTRAAIEAVTDPRVRYVRLEQNSGGCSAPRNTGLEFASAPFVMFCDSDDELPRQAAALLLEAAEGTAADVVCGLAERVDVTTGETKRWRAELHAQDATVESLEQLPELLYDTISVNKLYRADFLRDHGITFPPGLLFEDQLFTLKVFLAARRITVISALVYRWYVDAQAEELSITQGRSQRRNITDRLAINQLMDAELHLRPELAVAKAVKFLRHEGYLYLATALAMPDPATILDPLREYLRDVPVEAFWEVRPMLRIALMEVLVGNYPAACSAMRFEKWASCLDGVLHVGDSITFEPRDHSVTTDTVHGRPLREWLDVSELVLQGVPWGQRRYLHTMDHEDHDLVTTADYLPDDPILARLAWCVLADGKGRARAIREMSADHTGTRITWRPVGNWRSTGDPLTRSQRGTLQLWIERDGVMNRSLVRSLSRELTDHLALTPTSEWEGPVGIDIAVGVRGAVQWNPVGRTHSPTAALRSVKRRLGAAAPAFAGDPQPVVDLIRDLPGNRCIIAVLPAYLADRSEWPLSLAQWADPRWYLLLGGKGAPSVPTNVRGFARDVREVDVATVVDLADVVVSDDPDVLARARRAGTVTIAFRPRMGAERYLLPPILGAMESESDVREQILRIIEGSV